MVGLIARETLSLSWLQQSVLVINAAFWLTNRRFATTAAVTFALSLVAFRGEQLCFDTQLTWAILAEYRGRMITLNEMSLLGHLRSNPPLWSWFVSWQPSYAIQQGYAAAISLACLMLCRDLYGDRVARLIAMTPLFQICCAQPMPDWIALFCLLCARVCWRDERQPFAAGWLLLAACWKYTVYALLPFFLWEFRGWSLPALLGMAAYWGVFAWQAPVACQRQVNFLLHTYSYGLARRAIFSPPSRAPLAASAAWRLPRFLRSALALPWYVWPLLGSVPWHVALLAFGIVFGGGNLKYLLLLIAVFPKLSDKNSV